MDKITTTPENRLIPIGLPYSIVMGSQSFLSLTMSIRYAENQVQPAARTKSYIEPASMLRSIQCGQLAMDPSQNAFILPVPPLVPGQLLISSTNSQLAEIDLSNHTYAYLHQQKGCARARNWPKDHSLAADADVLR